MDMKIPGHLECAQATHQDMQATVCTLIGAVCQGGPTSSNAIVPTEMVGMAATLKLEEKRSVKTLPQVIAKHRRPVSHKAENQLSELTNDQTLIPFQTF